MNGNIVGAVMLALFGTFGLVMGFLVRNGNPGGFSPGIPFAGFGTLMLLGALYVGMAPARHRRRERRRGARLRTWAMAHGWSYQEAPLTPEGKPHAPGTRLRLGTDRLLETVIDGAPVAVGEASYLGVNYSHTGGSLTASGVTRYVTVFALRLPGRWPDLEVTPHPAAVRLVGAAFRARGGLRPGVRDFDMRFAVTSRDPAARRIIGPALMDAHLDGRLSAWRLQDGEIITTDHRRLDPDAVPAGLDRLRLLAALLTHPA